MAKKLVEASYGFSRTKRALKGPPGEMKLFEGLAYIQGSFFLIR
jgi:hypothetical protein